MTALEIEIREPNQPPRRLPLKAGLSLGRHPDNSCLLNDPKVSAFHARIEADGDAYFLVDLGSSNGTHIVDGKTLGAHERWPLEAGSSFITGLTEIEVKARTTATTAGQATQMMSIDEPTLMMPPTDEQAIQVSGDLPPIPADEDEIEATVKDDDKTQKHEHGFHEEATEPPKKRGEARPLDVPSKGVPVSPNSDLSPMVDFDQDTGSFPEFDLGGRDPAKEPKRAKDGFSSEDKTVGQPRVVFDQDLDAGPGPDPDEETILSPPERRGGVGKAPSSPPQVSRVTSDQKTLRTPVPEGVGRSLPDDDDEATLVTDPTANHLPKADEGLSFMRPRLVLFAEGLRGVEPITKREFRIGRRGGGGPQHVECALDHATVSSQHAVIVFRQGRFFIEDKGSRNGTMIAGKPLGDGGSKELRADEHIVFGMVDALFVVDRDHQLRELPRSPYGDALNFLVRKKRIKRELADQLWQRCAVDGDHPAESLVLSGQVTVKQWCEALDAAGGSSMEGGSKRNMQLILLVVAVVLAIGIAVILLEFR